QFPLCGLPWSQIADAPNDLPRARVERDEALCGLNRDEVRRSATPALVSSGFPHLRLQAEESLDFRWIADTISRQDRRINTARGGNLRRWRHPCAGRWVRRLNFR